MLLPRSAVVAMLPLGLWLAVAACGDDNGSTPEGGGLADGGAPGSSGGQGDAANGEGGADEDGGPLAQNLCNAEGFCWENPLPHGAIFSGIWASAPNDVWAGGPPGTLMHFDGVTWKATPLATVASFTNLWGSGPNDLWAGGSEFSAKLRAVLYHYDGKSWTLGYASAGAGGAHVNAIWGSGSKDVWAAGESGQLLHYDGTSWTPKTAVSGSPGRVSRVHATSATDVWALTQPSSDPSAVLHYDGEWHTMATGLPATVWFTSVWAAGPKDVWVASFDGDDQSPAFLHFDGDTWTPSASPAPLNVSVMWGSGPKDIWAASQGAEPPEERFTGFLLHYDGTAWSKVTLDPSIAKGFGPIAIGGSGPKDVWIGDVGRAGLLHYDGASWALTARSTIVDGTISGIWSASTTDTWAVGGAADDPPVGFVLHHDGHKWLQRSLGAIASLSSVHGSAANNVWAVGLGGAAYRFDGTTWTPVDTGHPNAPLAKVWTSSPNDVWATSQKIGNTPPVVLHFDGQTWTDTLPTDATDIDRIWGSSATDLWLAGRTLAGTVVFHGDGTTWGEPVSLVSDKFGSTVLWGTGPKDVWFGTQHFDGTNWTATDSDPHVKLTSTWGRGPKDVWTLGFMGELLHYDGTRWSLASTAPSGAAAVGGTTNALWVVGGHGMILKKGPE